MSRLSCVLAVAGCFVSGSTIHASRAGAVATPAQCAPPHAFTGASATKYQSNCLLCALVETQGIASTYHLPGAKPAALATALAQKTAPPDLRKAVHDGCLHGFHFAAHQTKTKPKPKTRAPAVPTPTGRTPPAHPTPSAPANPKPGK